MDSSFYDGLRQYYLHNMTRGLFLKMYNDSKVMGIAESDENVKKLDFEYIDSWIKTLRESPEILNTMLLFSINGYDDDNRELYEIPEVRKYIKALLERHPDFLIYFKQESRSWIMLCATVNSDVAPVAVREKQVKLKIDNFEYRRIMNRAVMESLKIPYFTDTHRNEFVKEMLEVLV